MSVATVTQTSTRVNVATRSVVWIANKMMAALTGIVMARGLPPERFQTTQHEVIMNGLRAWLAREVLCSVVIEVSNPATGLLVEKYPLEIEYKTEQSEDEGFNNQCERFEAALSKLPPLPPNCTYRLLARLKPGAPKMPGWNSSKAADDRHLEKAASSALLDSASINVQVSVWTEKRSEEPCK